MSERRYDLDHLRVFLTILVVVHHASITYGAAGSWYFEDVDRSTLTITTVVLTLFTAVNQSFFMGLFFLLSAYFTPGSYERKGPGKFLGDRLQRLGIPLLFYFFILGPFVTYIAKFQSMNFLTFYQEYILTFKILSFGPLWFVETLLYFAVLYIILRKSIGPFYEKLNSIRLTFPSNKKILLSILVIGTVSFTVRLIYPTGKEWLGLQFGYFPSYIFFMILGIIAYHQRWLENIPNTAVKTWFRCSLISLPVLPIALIAGGALDGVMTVEGGLNIQALVYAFWEPFVAMGLILKLFQVFHQRLAHSNRLRKQCSNTAFTVFVIHPLILVSLSLILQPVLIAPAIKFIIAAFLGTVLCFVLAAIIYRIPYLNRIL